MTTLEGKHILITDIGSTTTKALLVSRDGDKMRFAGACDVPTTVEKPTEDVKIGIIKAVKEVEMLAGVKILDKNDRITVPYITTSSAGGGLQILVFGLASTETGRVAEMTAYGAGGVILKTLTIDDEILAVDKMRLIRELHPDMVLMAGGLDGGAIAGVVRLAELLTLADPEPKFRSAGNIPLVFCGNKDARDFVVNVLEDNFDVHVVDNVRPDTGTLNITPAKDKVHDLFMENVMERAPGYADLKKWVARDILPTPVGVERILRLYSAKLGENVLMVDMGGATTDIFSNIAGDYYRTVAANLGMSYSVSNILKEAGAESIMRHLPEEFKEGDVRDYIANKTLNPTYVPRNDAERLVEQATAAEGMEEAWEQHREMNFKIAKLGWLDRRKKIIEYNKFEDVFMNTSEEFFQLSDIDLIVGAGGILAHVDSPAEAFWMLTEGFKPRGIVKLAVDRQFKSPHLGVLSTVEPDAALRLFTEECLEELGYVVAPTGEIRPDKKVLDVRDNKTGRNFEVAGGKCLYLAKGGDLVIEPHGKVCISQNKDRFVLKTGLPVIFDCRGRDEQTVKRARMLDVPLTKTGIKEFTFKPGKWSTNIKPQSPAEIKKGSFEIERRLPYEGSILVKETDSVGPDDLVGENKYGPPKLYILDINRIAGYSNPLTETQIKQDMLIKVGDRIHPGQHVCKIRPYGVLGISYYYNSPVRGTVTRIEPQGLVILREIQDYDEKPHKVKVAKLLDVRPKTIETYLKFREGDFVEKDRILAQNLKEMKIVKSPATGVVKKIDTDKGTVTIQYDLQPVPLKSFVSGRIMKVKKNHSVRIAGEGAILSGIIGFGSEAWGRLAVIDGKSGPDASHKDMIAVSFEPVDEAFLRKTFEHRLAGVIAPSIPNADWVKYYGHEMGVALTGDENIPFVLILTEGFGDFQMNASYRDFLKKADGKIASISGRTQIRAGVTRPMVIISD